MRNHSLKKSIQLTLAALVTMTANHSLHAQVADRDSDGIPDTVEAQVGTDSSVKDNAIFSDTKLFVMQQYRDFLAREADSSSIGFWVQQINSGQRSRAQFVQDNINSAEFQNTAAPVVRMFMAYFERNPDTVGLEFWQGRARAGDSLLSISNAFASSQEFINKYGSLSNRDFVNRVYQNVLGRPVDAAGGNYWTSELDAKRITRGGLMLQFSESTEYKALKQNAVFVIMTYYSMLDRGVDPAGFTYWESQLKQGVSPLTLVNSFLESDEYRKRFIVPLSLADAGRLYAQATFGAKRADLYRTKDLGLETWLREQFNVPQTPHLTLIRSDLATTDGIDRNSDGKIDAEDGRPGWDLMRNTIWKQFFEGNDQLRQRVGYALSQILVISQQNNIVLDNPEGSASYLDILNKHSFGNFKDLLKDVTLNPGMGTYLDMKGSQKEDVAKSIQPNENYARELLQLFSLGTAMLNVDGTEQLVNGKTIPTYDEDTVKGFAKALTGYNFARQAGTELWRWTYPESRGGRWGEPMQQWRDSTGAAIFHDTAAKKLLQYPGAPFANLPANQTPDKDLDDVITNIFNHPNVGPFISKQLIQRLVTSNPTPAYVGRVAAIFNNNGSGVRGDMKAVVRAILIDSEARTYNPDDTRAGKLREPVTTFVQFHRAFGGTCDSGRYHFYTGNDDLGQRPLYAPSVFNFYSPDYAPSGSLSNANLVAPEFEVVNSTQILNFGNFSQWGMLIDYGRTNLGEFAAGGQSLKETDPKYQYRNCKNQLNYGAYLTMADNPKSLIDELDVLFMNQQMSAGFKTSLVTAMGKLTETDSSKPAAENLARQRAERVRLAVWLIMNSPEFAVLK